MRWAGRGCAGTKPRPRSFSSRPRSPHSPAPAVGLQVPAESVHVATKVGVWPVFSGYEAQRVEPKCLKGLGKNQGRNWDSEGRDQQALPQAWR